MRERINSVPASAAVMCSLVMLTIGAGWPQASPTAEPPVSAPKAEEDQGAGAGAAAAPTATPVSPLVRVNSTLQIAETQERSPAERASAGANQPTLPAECPGEEGSKDTSACGVPSESAQAATADLAEEGATDASILPLPEDLRPAPTLVAATQAAATKSVVNLKFRIAPPPRNLSRGLVGRP